MKKNVMRFVTGIALSATLIAPTVGHTEEFTPEQQEQAQICMVQAVLAKETMIYRQQGLKKTEASKKLKDEYIKSDSSQGFSDTMNVMLNTFITMAYNEPIAKTDSEKEKATSDFSWEVAKMCMKELVGVDIGEKE